MAMLSLSRSTWPWPLSSHSLNYLDRIGARGMTMVSGSWSLNMQLAMTTSKPVELHCDLSGLLIYIHNNFFEQQANDALFDAHVARIRMPYRFEIFRQDHELLTINFKTLRDLLIKHRYACIDILYAFE